MIATLDHTSAVHNCTYSTGFEDSPINHLSISPNSQSRSYLVVEHLVRARQAARQCSSFSGTGSMFLCHLGVFMCRICRSGQTIKTPHIPTKSSPATAFHASVRHKRGPNLPNIASCTGQVIAHTPYIGADSKSDKQTSKLRISIRV
jgi:hypothetical protein